MSEVEDLKRNWHEALGYAKQYGAERDEAREQVEALQHDYDEAKASYIEAREQVGVLEAEKEAYVQSTILLLYREWSEETYAASFMSPSKDTVSAFTQWLENRKQFGLEQYELDMLAEYNKQKAESEGGAE